MASTRFMVLARSDGIVGHKPFFLNQLNQLENCLYAVNTGEIQKTKECVINLFIHPHLTILFGAYYILLDVFYSKMSFNHVCFFITHKLSANIYYAIWTLLPRNPLFCPSWKAIEFLAVGVLIACTPKSCWNFLPPRVALIWLIEAVNLCAKNLTGLYQCYEYLWDFNKRHLMHFEN